MEGGKLTMDKKSPIYDLQLKKPQTIYMKNDIIPKTSEIHNKNVTCKKMLQKKWKQVHEDNILLHYILNLSVPQQFDYTVLTPFSKSKFRRTDHYQVNSQSEYYVQQLSSYFIKTIIMIIVDHSVSL